MPAGYAAARGPAVAGVRPLQLDMGAAVTALLGRLGSRPAVWREHRLPCARGNW
jgi:hypothetical protein